MTHDGQGVEFVDGKDGHTLDVAGRQPHLLVGLVQANEAGDPLDALVVSLADYILLAAQIESCLLYPFDAGEELTR